MDKNRHLITKYLDRELDEISSTRFEEDLLKDPDLKMEMSFYRDVFDSIADQEVLDLRAQLNSLHEPAMQGLKKSSSKTFKRTMRYAVTAATVSLLLGFGVFSLLRDSNIPGKYFTPYDVTMVNRSADTNIDLTLQEALLKYENQQYREAVILFEQVLASDNEMLSSNLYAGISYLEIKEYQRAEGSFNKIINHNNNLFIEQAEWYMGFCYLMTERREKAIKQFSKIAEKNAYYSDKAKDILKRLK